MLGVKSLDYNNYYTALKGNYRKGVHRFRTILANPQLAQEFAQNVGGVSVVLGWPISHDDKNSQELLSMLLAHDVLTAATLTWLSQWYPEDTDSADALMGNATRCGEIKADALMWRAVTANPELVGKLAATLAGLDCSQYADIAAVAASSTAMAAVAASSTAMAAIIASSTALNAVVSSSTAMTAVAASSTAMAAVAASQTAMAAVAASQTAMAAIIASSTALNAVVSSSTAMAAIIASSTALNAVVSSSTAMTAVAASSTAMTAVVASSTAMTAVAGSSTAMQAVIANSAALSKVVASSTAMTAVANSATARNAVYNSATAKTALDASPLKKTVRAAYSTQSNNEYTNFSGKAFILKTTGSGSGSWTFYNLYDPPTATSTKSKSMGTGNAFNLYLVGANIRTQHSGGSASDYIDIQYIPV